MRRKLTWKRTFRLILKVEFDHVLFESFHSRKQFAAKLAVPLSLLFLGRMFLLLVNVEVTKFLEILFTFVALKSCLKICSVRIMWFSVRHCYILILQSASKCVLTRAGLPQLGQTSLVMVFLLTLKRLHIEPTGPTKSLSRSILRLRR